MQFSIQKLKSASLAGGLRADRRMMPKDLVWKCKCVNWRQRVAKPSVKVWVSGLTFGTAYRPQRTSGTLDRLRIPTRLLAAIQEPKTEACLRRRQGSFPFPLTVLEQIAANTRK
jgi:hypothetical protein